MLGFPCSLPCSCGVSHTIGVSTVWSGAPPVVLPLEGVSVSVYASGGALVGSGLTNSAGNCTLSLPSALTGARIVASGPRLVTMDTGYTRTLAAGGSTSIQTGRTPGAASTGALNPAAGYAMIVNHAWPVSQTLHLGDSAGNSMTLSWTAASPLGWMGLGSRTTVGYAGCPSRSARVRLVVEQNASSPVKAWQCAAGGGCPFTSAVCTPPYEDGAYITATWATGRTVTLSQWTPSGGAFLLQIASVGVVPAGVYGGETPIFSITE